MSSDSQLWYRLGYLLERARERPTEVRETLTGLAERVTEALPGHGKEGGRSPFPLPEADQLLATGLAAIAGRLLAAWRPRHATGVGDLLRGTLAGAGAALIVELARPLLRGKRELPALDDGTFDRLLSGAGQGLVYGAVVEPRIGGPGFLRGAAFGAAEYALVPLGGLSKLFGRATPQGRIPVVGRVLDGLDGRDRAFLEHLAFGVAIGVLYGVEEKSGISLELGEV